MSTIKIDDKEYFLKPQAAVDKIAQYLSGDKFQQIPIKSSDEIAKLKVSGHICASILDEISPHIKPGVTRQYLNEIILDLIQNKYQAQVDRLSSDVQTDAGRSISACFGHNNIIVNAEPDDVQLKAGDIFGIDISVQKNGWCGDTRKSWLVGEESSPTILNLFSTSHGAMWLAIGMIKAGVKVNDIAKAVEAYANKNGCSMIKLPHTCGHSLGKAHIDGWLIPLYDSKINEGRILEEGMVITIETFMSSGSGEAMLLDNEIASTITKDGAPACYWEHAVVVTKNGCEILDLRAEEKEDWKVI